MICTLLTFFCGAWQFSPSLSLSAVSVSFGSPNASFLCVKEANNTTKNAQKLTIEMSEIQKFTYFFLCCLANLSVSLSRTQQ